MGSIAGKGSAGKKARAETHDRAAIRAYVERPRFGLQDAAVEERNT